MKKEELRGILLLMGAGILAFWLNWEPAGSNSRKQSDTFRADRFILAASWQPAFCESRPNRAECRSQRKGRFDVLNFSLHGLWPQTNGLTHCGVRKPLIALDRQGKWNQLAKLDLSADLRNELSIKMPGYRSYLHRHEWYKHGTCIRGASPEAYFRISLALLDQLNNSSLRTVMVNNLGKKIRYEDIAFAVNGTIGKSIDNRVIMDCYWDNGRRIIEEFKLSIAGPLDDNTSLWTALSFGEPVGRSCPFGVVDPVGLQ